MSYFIRVILILLVASIPVFGEAAPHLILYFDINKTLIASDKAGNKSVEDVLNELLAEKYTARWDSSLEEPMSFEAYVSQKLAPGKDLRNERKYYLHHFIEYLEREHHPLYYSALLDYQEAVTALNASPGKIVPSFYRLVEYLDRKGISYSIILRSFGEEVLEVKNSIERGSEIRFSQTGKFREGKLLLDDDAAVEDFALIYPRLRRIEHTAIHDDWNHWFSHDMAARQGKPFYVDREDSETLSIFFDDNIMEKDSIHNIVAPLDARTGELIPVEELIESGQAVRVDTLQAITHRDYYIICVENALNISH